MSYQEIIVDASDRVIGAKASGTIDYEDIYRVSALWLTDRATGDALLAQRKWTKQNDPGKWGPAVAGTIEEGETYETNMVKEIEEEIGLTGLELTTGPKQYVDDGKHKFFCQYFFATVDKNQVELRIQEDEVEAVKWISLADLIQDVTEHPDRYTPSMAEVLGALGVMDA